MIALIWIMFVVFDIIILSVVLMNFLIAIIGESYAEVMENQKNNIYKFRAYLNLEYSRSALESSSVNSKKKFDSIFMASCEDDLNDFIQDHS